MKGKRAIVHLLVLKMVRRADDMVQLPKLSRSDRMSCLRWEVAWEPDVRSSEQLR